MTLWQRAELLCLGAFLVIVSPSACESLGRARWQAAELDAREKSLLARIARDQDAADHLHDFRARVRALEEEIDLAGDASPYDAEGLAKRIQAAVPSANVLFHPKGLEPLRATISGAGGRRGALRALHRLLGSESGLVLLRLEIAPDVWSANLSIRPPSSYASDSDGDLLPLPMPGLLCYADCLEQRGRLLRDQAAVRNLERLLGGDAIRLESLRAEADALRLDEDRLLDAVPMIDALLGGPSPPFETGLFIHGNSNDLFFIGAYAAGDTVNGGNARDPFRPAP